MADNSSGFAVAGTLGTTSGRGDGDGSDIPAILITENASWDESRKPTVVITGAIHGNEWATPEVCLGIAEYLLANKDNSEAARDDFGMLINEAAQKTGDGKTEKKIVPSISDIARLLKTVQVVIVPVLNPDGYDFSHTDAGRKSYYGAGWRPNRRIQGLLDQDIVCYRQDGSQYASVPSDVDRCFLADFDDTADGGDLEEEEVVVCESRDGSSLYLFEPSLNVDSAEMFDALYGSTDPARVVCASSQRRVWKDAWPLIGEDTVALKTARADGYLQESSGVDLNRNFQYKWDVVQDQKHLFIRSRSPSSRMFRGRKMISEAETAAMERLVARMNVVALIDYHAGSTQVLYPYAYSTTEHAEHTYLGKRWGKNDYEAFRLLSEQIASILNRHDRGDPSIVNFTAAQNYNDVSVGSGVARDCYYQTERIAAINIEVHDKRYTYENEEFRSIVPKICKINVPGAVWFMFWAADLGARVED
ncbi:hypothetical protein GF1_06780 [Desulfolithobacter dissulfuricans]|uniref:Peptidase M14 domain-containing protein n=1 Tax=Desulfolithobacter dissulfuricans TaxID=2795293 RepID=A0A915U4T8_9BACT|nr:M14 family zinc carboxypeptidase [Desulfolithobacter dissulfuricans]BCO08302.1 hypothetical protein GF1_06780 [Desulfolithobacter dissulfuricans]